VILATFDLELAFCAVTPGCEASPAALESVDSGIEPEAARSETTAVDGEPAETVDAAEEEEEDDDDDDEVVAGIASGG